MLLDLGRGFRELDATRFAAAARVHLGLHDPEVAAQRGGGGLRLGGRRRYLPFGNRNAVLGKKSLGLILVQIHWKRISATAGGGILHETRGPRKARAHGRTGPIR